MWLKETPAGICCQTASLMEVVSTASSCRRAAVADMAIEKLSALLSCCPVASGGRGEGGAGGVGGGLMFSKYGR